MEYFISFIVDLINEDMYEKFDGYGAKWFLLHGGCYEFAKILCSYIKGSKIVLDQSAQHCGVLCKNGVIYDANGKVISGNFKIATEDIRYMENSFGIVEKSYIKGKKISEYFIE